MKILVFCTVLALVNLSWASQFLPQKVNPPEGVNFNLDFNKGGVSKFDMLTSYFQTGDLPTPTQLAGNWSGRCYSKTNEKPQASLLTAHEVTHTSNQSEGPLFPPEVSKTFNLATVQSYGLGDAPDLFDSMGPRLKVMLNSFLLSSEFKDLVSSVEDRSLVSRNEQANAKYVVRKYQNYFLVQLLVLQDVANFKSGDIYQICYYFKKVD